MQLSILHRNVPHKQPEKELPDFPKTVAVQMPHVFVVPPEEDEAPAWCCFDAANPALSQVVERSETPDIAILAFPSDPRVIGQDVTGPVIMPPRSDEALSIVDALMNGDIEGDDDTESECSELEDNFDFEDDPNTIQERDRHETPRLLRDAADDSDVIEVVKVRRKGRSSEEAEEAHAAVPDAKLARSKTLKSRASKAFQSLRGSLRSKPRAQNVFPSNSSRSSSHTGSSSIEQTLQETQTLPRARAPTVSRRGSRILSQLFNAPPLKNRSSVATFDDELSPISPTQANIPSSEPSQNAHELHHRSSMYDAFIQDQVRLRAASPAPTTASKSSARRFSRLNLHKLFSKSPSPAPELTTPISFDDDDDVPDRAPTPTLRSVTSTPASSSISSTSGPQTPTSTDGTLPLRLVGKEDAAVPAADLPVFDTLESGFDTNGELSLGLGLGINQDSTPDLSQFQQATPRKSSSSSSSMWNAITPRLLGKSRASSPPLEDDEDMSLEMRLDSLHFESLSFDADRF